MKVFTRVIVLLCFLIKLTISGTVYNDNFEVLLETPSTKYIFSNEAADPESASEICNSQHGQLLAIENLEENLLVAEKLRERGISSIWLSGIEFSNATIPHSYFWSSTGDRFQYYNFHESSTNLARSIRNKRSPLDEAKCGTCDCSNWPIPPFKKPVCNAPNCTINSNEVKCTKIPVQSCEITKDPECKTKRGECKVECGSEKCKILSPVCTIKSDKPRCYLKPVGECEITRSKCIIVPGECKAERNCTVDETDACTIVTKPCENPCTQIKCDSVTPPCTQSTTCTQNTNGTTSSPDDCKTSTNCPPSTTVCSRPFVDCSPEFCQSTVQICKPPRVVCGPLQFICESPKIYCKDAPMKCPEPEVVCEDPKYECSKPIIKCPDPVVNCDADVTTCDSAPYTCTEPQGTCDDKPNYTCQPPNICELTSSNTVDPTTTEQITTEPDTSSPQTTPDDLETTPGSTTEGLETTANVPTTSKRDCNSCCRKKRAAPPPETEYVETKKCVVMKKDLGFKWETQSCEIKHQFICEKKKIAKRSLFDFMF